MSRYTEAHANPVGPGDSRPTALQIVQDEGLEGKLKGKIIVITGTSSGLGIETVRALAATGATLYLTARNLVKARQVLAGIFNPTQMELFGMDQESLDSVRAAAGAILAKTDRVNVLINNAGIMGVRDLQLTRDGHELQFGTNHLSHFLFFQLLKPALLAASTRDFPSRVVNVASAGHRFHGINESGNYNYEKGGYDGFEAYGQSKTANIYMANDIERRYGSRDLHATSLHPGVIDTPLSKHIDPAQLSAILANPAVARHMKSPEQGAATTVWAAVGKEWGRRGGRFLTDCMEAAPAQDDSDIYDGRFYAPYAYDADNERRLRKDSLELVGLKDED